MTRPQRPRLTLKIMFYAIFDVVGMVFFASGALWFARGQSLFIPDFPGTMAGALAAIVGGFMLMLWAAAQIVREMIKRPDNVVEEDK
jgi:hypothetical protein